MSNSLLRYWPDPVLATVSDPWDFLIPQQDPQKFSALMIATMLDERGIGLSANQIGFTYRVIAMHLRTGQNIVLFNPELVESSSQTCALPEGCLSFPGAVINRARPQAVQARWQDHHGQVITGSFSEIDAVCFLHELDHINGITISANLDPMTLLAVSRRAQEASQSTTNSVLTAR